MARKKKKDPIPVLVVPKNATLKQIYARAREEFTAADLAEFARPIEELLEGSVPADQLIAELEEIQRRESRKRRKKR